MTHWVGVATLDELWQGEILAATADTVGVLLCNIDGEVFAYEDRCPHLANPLSKGTLDAHILVCAAHEWEFDLKTGRGVNPASTCLRRFPVRFEGESILVDPYGSEP